MGVNKLPDFIIPGFQKCGTTSLYHNLLQHPRIEAPTKFGKFYGQFHNGKELNFFSQHFDKGPEWYKRFFPDNGQHHFDCSPNYSWHPDRAFANMRKAGFSGKLVFSMRHPVLRAFSAYNHYKQAGLWLRHWSRNKGFLWNMRNSDAFKLNYATVLKCCAEELGRDNMLIIIQEQLMKDPQREFDRMFEFLDLPRVRIRNKKIHKRNSKISIADYDGTLRMVRSEMSELYEWLGRDIKEWERD